MVLSLAGTTSVSQQQELAAAESVAPFICGAAVAEGPLFPGETWRGTLMVDEDICPDAIYSVVSMLSECLPKLSRTKHQPCSIARTTLPP